MADFEVKQTNGSEERVVTIRGKMTILYAHDIKAALVEALARAQHIRLDLEDVTEMDLAGMQLICAAHRDCINLKKKLSVSGNTNEVFSGFAAASGFSRHVACVEGETCFWGGGGN